MPHRELLLAVPFLTLRPFPPAVLFERGKRSEEKARVENPFSLWGGRSGVGERKKRGAEREVERNGERGVGRGGEREE